MLFHWLDSSLEGIYRWVEPRGDRVISLCDLEEQKLVDFITILVMARDGGEGRPSFRTRGIVRGIHCVQILSGLTMRTQLNKRVEALYGIVFHRERQNNDSINEEAFQIGKNCQGEL